MEKYFVIAAMTILTALVMVQLGIEQTQRKLDAIQRSMRKAGENPKATKEAMRLGSQLSALKSVMTTQVNPTINVVQAIEGNADAQNTFNTLREQLIDTAQQINAAESQGDTATAESLKAQLPQLQEQTAKAWAYFQTLNEETAKAILQTAPQVLSKVYGQRRNAVNPLADVSAGNVNADDMPNIQQQVSDILIGDKNINYDENATQNVGNAYGNQSEVTPYQNNELPIDKARRELNELEIQARKTESEYNAARERGEYVTQLGQEYEELRNKINAKQAEIKQLESPVTYGSNEDDEQQSIGNAYGNNKQTSPQKESALSKATRELNELKKAFTLTTNAKNDADNRGEIDEADKLSQKLNDLKNKIDAKNDEINRLKKDIPINYDENAEQFGKTSPNPQSQIQNEEDTVSVNLNNYPQEPNERLYYDENADQFVGNSYGNTQPKPKQTSPQKESALGKAQKKLEQLKQQLAETFNEKNSADEREDYNGSEKARQKLKGINQKIIDTENEIKKLESQSQTADNAQSPKAESIKIKSTFTQDVLPDENNVVKGDKTKIVADNGKEYEVQYKVIEADDLIASHILSPLDSQVDRNENYPAELQPRDRDRISMQTELLSMANALRPADLMDSRNLNQGAPIVRSDNVVLNGNGRTAAIKFAYENAKADHYKQVLVNNSEKFGLNRESVVQMKNPVLVREITDNLSAQDLQAITESQTGGVKFGASEQAKNDAGKIKVRTLDLYVDNDNGDINTADNRDFLVSVLQDILNKNELNAYTTADGSINVDGQRRAKRALFALAYDDDTLIDKIAESTDDNTRKLTNALESAAPRMAQIQAKMKEGILHNYDLSDIASAATQFSNIRKDKKLTVQDYLGQQVLAAFGEESEIKKALVKFFDEHKDSAIYVSDFLKGIADGIERQGNPNQGNLFDDGEPAKAMPLMNLLDSAKEIAADKLRERSERAKPKQINLFEESEETPAEKTPAERIGEALKTATSAPVQNEDEQVPTLNLQQPLAEVQMLEENVNKEEKIDGTSPEAWRNREEIEADIESKGLRRIKKETTIDDEIMDISHVAPNIDISEEDRLWAELDKEFSKLSANPIFNPKIYTIGLKLGMLYIKKV